MGVGDIQSPGGLEESHEPRLLAGFPHERAGANSGMPLGHLSEGWGGPRDPQGTRDVRHRHEGSLLANPGLRLAPASGHRVGPVGLEPTTDGL